MVFGQIYQVFKLQKDNSLRNVSCHQLPRLKTSRLGFPETG